MKLFYIDASPIARAIQFVPFMLFIGIPLIVGLIIFIVLRKKKK